MRELTAFWLSLLVLVLVTACATPCKPTCKIDANEFKIAFGSKTGDVRFNPDADFDNSGTITTADYAVFQQFCEE